MANIQLGLRGVNGQRWEIDYYNVVSFEASGDITMVTVKDTLNKGLSRILVQISLDSFLNVYNQCKESIERLQTITFKELREIEDRHRDFFNKANSKVTDYLNIFWRDPVEMSIIKDKYLPAFVEHDISQKFRILES